MHKIVTIEELAQVFKYGWHLFIDFNGQTAHLERLSEYREVEYTIAVEYAKQNYAGSPAME